MGEKTFLKSEKMQETKQTELLMIKLYSILPFFYLYFILTAEKSGVTADLRPNHQHWKCLLCC